MPIAPSAGINSRFQELSMERLTGHLALSDITSGANAGDPAA